MSCVVPDWKPKGQIFVAFASLCFVFIATPTPSRAEQPLRWRLKPGESLTVRINQQTTSKVAFSGKSAESKIELGLELLWTVDSAVDDRLKVKQVVQRITFSLQPQTGTAIQYDSLNPARPTGQARQVAEAVKPLVGAEVLMTMSDRGQILESAPANAAAEKLFDEAAGKVANVFSLQSLQTLLRQPLAVLPERAVTADDRWSGEPREITTAAGTFQQVTEYRLVGPVEEGGRQVEKIETTAKLSPVTAGAAKASKLTLKSHEQSGTILFSPEQGRLVRAELTQKLATERPYRETTITVALDSQQSTTIEPAGEQGRGSQTKAP
jgi:hypothetical protein